MFNILTRMYYSYPYNNVPICWNDRDLNMYTLYTQIEAKKCNFHGSIYKNIICCYSEILELGEGGQIPKIDMNYI